MRKPKYYSDRTPELGNTAVLMWPTQAELYTLAIGLNEIYGIYLTRDDDLNINTSLQTVVCPCFTYADEVRQMFYVLLGNPILSGGLGGSMNNYDAILLIIGDGVWEVQQRIYGDFCGMRTKPDDFDWRECERYEMLQKMIARVMQTDYFDLRDESEPRSSVYSNFSNNVKNKSVGDFFRQITICLKSILWTIEDEFDREPENEMYPNSYLKELADLAKSIKKE